VSAIVIQFPARERRETAKPHRCLTNDTLRSRAFTSYANQICDDAIAGIVSWEMTKKMLREFLERGK
jgi:hypothetical protein